MQQGRHSAALAAYEPLSCMEHPGRIDTRLTASNAQPARTMRALHIRQVTRIDPSEAKRAPGFRNS